MELDVKTLELDKVCRVCLTAKKDMRPLFGEMVAEMLMEFSQVQVNKSLKRVMKKISHLFLIVNNFGLASSCFVFFACI